MNETQVDRFSRMGVDHGETAVWIADGKVTHARASWRLRSEGRRGGSGFSGSRR
jgi:hypothetical protein